jgi:aryl-alcohol dehydrogenase-like predicted oxidoreductase
MRYKRIGTSGLAVSELCLGTNTFGGGKQEFWKTLGGLEQDAVNAIVAHACEAGINFIDTANTYSQGESEERVGQAIKDLKLRREDLVIATKIGGRVGPGPNAAGASRSHLLAEVENSLRRLKVDYLDICMLHFFDPATSLEESLRTLDRLVRDGKVRYLGCSNFAAWETMKALGLSEREGLERFEMVESHWSLATRELEREVVPLVLDQKLGLLVWGPLLGGLLTGKFSRDGARPAEGRSAGQIPPVLSREKVFDVVDTLRAVATPRGVTPGHIALAWLLHQPAVTSVLFGSRSVAQVADNLKAVEIKLSPEELAALDRATALTPDYGSWLVQHARKDRAQLLRSPSEQ